MQALPVTVRVGAASPTGTVGATGRVASSTPSQQQQQRTAAVSPFPPSASPSSSSTPKPAGATATASVVSATVAAPAPAATAPDGTTMLSAPLGLQASVLSQPSFYPSLGEDLGDFTEEGDILFAVLGDPWSRLRTAEVRARSGDGDREERTATHAATAAAPVEDASTSTGATTAAASAHQVRGRMGSLNGCTSSTYLCVQPVLTLPRKVGVSLACEVFRALLCFHNAANYPLTQAHFHVGVAQPPAPLRRALIRRTVATLPAKSNYTIVAAVPLGEASTYALAVAVDYNDPSGRQRQLSWNSTLKTEQPIMEAQPRKLELLRPLAALRAATPSSTGGASPSRFQDYARYQLTVGLRNNSSVPLILTSTELLLPSHVYHNGKPLFCHLSPRPAAASAPSAHQLMPQHSLHAEKSTGTSVASTTSANSVSGTDVADGRPVFLMPGDTLSLVYVVGLYLEELRHATVVHGQGGVATRLLSPRLASFGHVQWTWCRANGETGTARSAPLRVSQLAAAAEVDLLVTGVRAATTAAVAASVSTADEKPTNKDLSLDAMVADSPLRLPPPAAAPTFLAGSPITVGFRLINHSSVHRYDVALKVRVERLAPQWLYTGPTVRLLGPLDYAGTLEFSLTLLPWQAGWLRVLQAAVEVVDARMPEAVLWPPAATAQLLQPVDAHGGSFASAAALAAEKDGDRPTLVATVPAVAQTAMKATACTDGDVLCEVLVL